MKVREIMNNVVYADVNSSVCDVAKIMNDNHSGSILLKEQGKVVGIMTERDILRKMVTQCYDPSKVKARDLMSSPLITIDADASIEDASNLMDEKRIRRLIVTENKKIAGKITANNISRNLKYLLGQKLLKIKAEEYVRPAYTAPDIV